LLITGKVKVPLIVALVVKVDRGYLVYFWLVVTVNLVVKIQRNW